MSALIFMDTGTTGLSLDDDIWEFAAIRREPDGSETEHHYFIEHDSAKCLKLPESFRIDHYSRFPRNAPNLITRPQLAAYVELLTADKPHVVGAVPNFDTERLALLLAEFNRVPKWHYHLIDVENLAVGWLARRDGLMNREAVPHPPWESDELSRAIDVELPGEGVRHTAMGDARWAMRLYDAVMGGATS